MNNRKKKKIINFCSKKKKKKNQNSVTITKYVDESGTVFPGNFLNKEIKMKILKSI